MIEDWDSLPDRVELFGEIDPNGNRQFLVTRMENGLMQFFNYVGPSYSEAILIAEDLARAHGLQVYDRVGTTAAEVGQ